MPAPSARCPARRRALAALSAAVLSLPFLLLALAASAPSAVATHAHGHGHGHGSDFDARLQHQYALRARHRAAAAAAGGALLLAEREATADSDGGGPDLTSASANDGATNSTASGGALAWTPSLLRRYAGDIYACTGAEPQARTCRKKPHGAHKHGSQSQSPLSSSDGSEGSGSSGDASSGSGSESGSGSGSGSDSSALLPPVSSSSSSGAPSGAWRLVTSHSGSTFFDGWNFWSYADPTHGLVAYQTRAAAARKRLAFVDEQGFAIMRADSWTDLPHGKGRDSVRIHSKETYDQGLVILDMNAMPFGCAVWPAWWGNGPNWPNGGEIDIIEGVNDGTVNQYTLHTAEGCTLAPSSVFTGRALSSDCYALRHKNAGCAIKDARHDGRGGAAASYGSALNAAGGGVFATRFDGAGVSIWFFPRRDVPHDIQAGTPDPSSWPTPSAQWRSATCAFHKYFYQINWIFDIVICGDWAGGAYASSGCPGTCAGRAMKGANFVDAVWNVTYVKVFQQHGQS